jgi:hypothetical protein
MKKFVSTILAAATVSLFTVADAQAATVDTYYVGPLNFSSGSNTVSTINNLVTDPTTGAYVSPLTKGTTFTDEFIFSGIPAASALAFSVTGLPAVTFSGNSITSSSSIAFTGASLYYIGSNNGFEGQSIPLTSVTASGATLAGFLANIPTPGATYVLELDGTALVNGATYSGTIGTYSVSPVPLPAAGSMLVAVLGLTGVAGRRLRKKHQAQA